MRRKSKPNYELLLSIFAILISLSTLLWETRFADITVNFSTIALSIYGGDHFVVPITFSNIGGQSTTIYDVLLRESYTRHTSTYVAWFSIKSNKMEAFLHEDGSKSATTPYIQAEFAPFTLSPGSQTTKFLVFNHFSSTPLLAAPARSIRYSVVVDLSSGVAEVSHCVTWPDTLLTTLATGGGVVDVVNQDIVWRASETPEGRPTVVNNCAN